MTLSRQLRTLDEEEDDYGLDFDDYSDDKKPSTTYRPIINSGGDKKTSFGIMDDDEPEEETRLHEKRELKSSNSPLSSKLKQAVNTREDHGLMDERGPSKAASVTREVKASSKPRSSFSLHDEVEEDQRDGGLGSDVELDTMLPPSKAEGSTHSSGVNRLPLKSSSLSPSLGLEGDSKLLIGGVGGGSKVIGSKPRSRMSSKDPASPKAKGKTKGFGIQVRPSLFSLLA